MQAINEKKLMQILIGEKIRNVRKSKKITQQELSDSSGFCVSIVSGNENGRFESRISTLMAFADVLQCEVHAFIPTRKEYIERRKGYTMSYMVENKTK